MGSKRSGVKSERPDLGSERPVLGSERPDLWSERLWGGDKNETPDRKNCPVWEHRSSVPPRPLPINKKREKLGETRPSYSQYVRC